MDKTLAPVVVEGKLNDKKRFRLDDQDPGDTAGWKKSEAAKHLETLGEELAELTNLLAYAADHALLVVFQGRDASGKDGVIRRVLSFGNVLNAHVHAFKAPTEEERSRDFLWRIHNAVPRRGEMSLFNRSHYEDIVAVRVHELLPKPVWESRYAAINDFERLLIDNKTLVLKFFLNVSQKEQIERLLDREKDPRTAWKLNVNDWREIPLWKTTTAAYEDVICRCGPAHAPWYVVPADHKWFRNLAVMERMVLALRPFREAWLEKLKQMRRETLPEVEELRTRLGVKSKAGKSSKSAPR